MGRRGAIAAVCAAALAAAPGCGSTAGGGTPAACLEGPGPYLRALRGAPGRVALAGGVAISDCLPENQGAGDLAGAGGAMVTAATRLDAAARSHPGGPANVALGYLVGAAQRAADRTQGIHSELVRRLAFAARYSPGEGPLPPAFTRAYRLGFDAGRAHG